ncbi:MAG: DUF4911 domain-containing protein [Deltaproteobacteria bacterium]|nr:DUF4911 domain-containing protein [Deltaproteobacteria bacterium]
MQKETTRFVFRVNRKDIAYLRGTIESYDGMAVVRTLDPSVALIETLVSPGCEKTLLELAEHLARKEALRLERVVGPEGKHDAVPVRREAEASD